MKNIDTILEEFNLEGKITEQHAEDIRGILRTAFAEYKKGLREAVERKKSKAVHTAYCSHVEAYIEDTNEQINKALDSVLELVK